jgi:predicted nucleic-acid-binding protein
MGFLEQAALGYTSNKFVDPAKAMGGNFIQQMYKDVAARNNAKRQKDAAVKSKVTDYIDKIDTTVDSNGLNDVMKSKTNNVLSNVRMELVDVINQLSNMEPNTEEYIQLNDRRNQLMEVPKKMQASIENYNKRKAEYLDDVDSDRISIADADNNEFASKIYTDEADFNWNPDGTISFVDNGKIIPFSDIKDPSLKAYDLADTILKDTFNYQKKGAKMSPEEESMKRNELNKLFDANPMAMASIIDDGMLGDLSSSMTVDPENFKEQKPEVIDLIINSMKDVANKSYNEKQAIARAKDSKKEPKMTQAEISRQEKQQRVRSRANSVVDGLVGDGANPMSTIRQYIGLDGVTKNGKVITIDDGDGGGMKYDLNRAEDVARLAETLEISKYGPDATTDLVFEQIPTAIDNIRKNRGKDPALTKDASYYINKYSNQN